MNDQSQVPAHLGVIPDGNRRWARARNLPTLEGHRRGLDQAKKIAMAAFDRGVKYFTIYGFSTENWNRTQEEVGYLMDLFYGLIKHEFRELDKRGVRFRLVGHREGLPPKILQAAEETEARTAGNTRGTVSLCLNYGGQTEIADAVASMIAAGISAGDVTPELVSQHMYAPDVPPVDFIVRSSGEERLSGFMLWRAAYAEFYFTDKHWPDFDTEDLEAALEEYARRQRRYGA